MYDIIRLLLEFKRCKSNVSRSLKINSIKETFHDAQCAISTK